MKIDRRNIIGILFLAGLLALGGCDIFSSVPVEAPSPAPSGGAESDISPTPTKKPEDTVAPTREAEKLVINEVMAGNKTYPINGTLCDWIELYNAGDSDISLSQFYLSDKEGKPLKCQLPDKVLGAGEYIVLTCETEISVAGSEEKTKVLGDLSFKLSGDGEKITLTREDGLCISSLDFEDLENDYTATQDGICDIPSPGYENTAEGHRMAQKKLAAAAVEKEQPGLIINELLSSNNAYKKYKNSQGVSDYYDLVELYNASTETILLSDYYLSDSAKHLTDYRLPELNLESGKYVIIYCMGRASANYDNPAGSFTVPESPIELSYFGETVYLTKKDGLIADCVTFPEMYDGVSYGRNAEDPAEFVILKDPTPGSKNGSGESDFSQKPVASVKSGSYDGSITVEFLSGGSIYYTTDCSIPTIESKVWDGQPITIDKTTTLRAICYEGDKLKSFESVYNYYINDLDLTLDVVSVSMSKADWEKLKASTSKSSNYVINIAFYKNSGDGSQMILSEEFSLGAVLELSGASSLSADKASYQIKFKSKYGPSKLKYKLFDNIDIDEFNSFNLRGGSQDSIYTTLRDEYCQSLLYSYYGEEYVLHEAYRPVNLYINNEYRGVYYIREHQDRDMIASHYSVDTEDVCFAKNMSPSGMIGGTEADRDRLKRAVELLKYGDLSDEKQFNELLELVDYESLLAYWSTELWMADNDCHLRVYKAGDGKWTFALHDMDLALRESCDYVYKDKFFNQNRQIMYRYMMSGLMKSDRFRTDLFAAMGKYSKTAYNAEYATKYLQESFIDVLSHDMKYNCDKWGNTRLYPKNPESYSKMATYATWQSKCEDLTNKLANRTDEAIKALKKYLNMTDEEEKLYFGEK